MLFLCLILGLDFGPGLGFGPVLLLGLGLVLDPGLGLGVGKQDENYKKKKCLYKVLFLV